MKLVFLTHPSFMSSQSMPRFANMLIDGMRQKGHDVQSWSPIARFYNFSNKTSLKKWLGYIDQYIVFPLKIRQKINSISNDTLFIFTDQALGPWVPLVAARKHIIHCHDFLAQKSALGEIPQNPTGWTGRKYQTFIYNGYNLGRNFISVSKQTQTDLHCILSHPPALSVVVYNGLNRHFSAANKKEAKQELEKKLKINLDEGFILHVGGNQWYKNRVGVITIYNAYRKLYDKPIPLLMIGAEPNSALKLHYNKSDYKDDVILLSGMDDVFVNLAYSCASVFLFPSLAEGFGWPIAEAMAAGCPVITTNTAPMTEVAGNAAFLIGNMAEAGDNISEWAINSAQILNDVITLFENERADVVERGLENVERFNSVKALNTIEELYLRILKDEKL